MNVILIGAGRMGLRHLRGLAEVEGTVVVVDPRSAAEADVRRAAAEQGVKTCIEFRTSLDDAPFGLGFDAAILATTARGRLEQLCRVAEEGIKDVLIEKPLEQSRARFRAIAETARQHGLRARCDHYRRTLPFFAELKKSGGPFQIVVSSGAFGLACNGVHWIDFALHLTDSRQPRMLFGEIEPTIIRSGRGPEFRDYGGRAVFGFEDGSRLFLSSSADSSAPTSVTIVQPTRHCVVDQEADLAIVYERNPASAKPSYLCGADYTRREVKGIETAPLWEITRGWIRSLRGQEACLLPTLEEAVPGHELLFDLLEISGETEFPIT